MSAARFEIYLVRHQAADSFESVGGATWRLLSNNNRDLGRAASIFEDIDNCLVAVEHLRRHAGSSTPVSLRAGRADWTWRVQIDQLPVAVSSRRYQRRVQAEYACGVFLGLVTDAVILNTARLVQR
jgi:hypothetical protein